MRHGVLLVVLMGVSVVTGCWHPHHDRCCPPPPCPPGGPPSDGPGGGGGGDVTLEIEINKTPADTDDYVTWAPTFCRIRQAGGSANLDVVLANDPPASKPLGGDLCFAPAVTPWPASATATADTLALSLPPGGTWVEFVIAGKFKKHSHDDKDAVIEVHDKTETGAVLATKALMVRVRRNANELKDGERARYLDALKQFRAAAGGGYVPFQDMHRLASTAGDEAHGQPSFLPWHRAYLLQVERELQKYQPSVALHYWNWDFAAPNVFHEDFMGAPGTTGFLDEPVFATSNPLIGWNTDLPMAMGRLQRSTGAHGDPPPSWFYAPLDDPMNPAGSMIASADYGPTSAFNSFSSVNEGQGHNPAHGWACTGGHLAGSNRSSADPVFFMLHSQVDRQWAYWQWKKDRLGVPSGGSLTFPAPGHYDNGGNWNDGGVVDWQRGSFLEDTLWPWDGTTGGAGRAQRPAFSGGGPASVVPISAPVTASTPFPASVVANLWPAGGVMVRNRDMIDYLGRFKPSDGLGYCYDDVPYK
jgi:tyrosinase